MGVQKFEDLKVWQKARELCNDIYKFSKRKNFSSDWGLSRQLQRSSVSIMANIAEGFERGSNREFANFLFISKSSVAETKSHLYLAYDQKYITEDELEGALEDTSEISRMLTNLIRHLKKNPKKGMRRD